MLDQKDLSRTVEKLYSFATEAEALRLISENLNELLSSNLGFFGHYDRNRDQQTAVSSDTDPKINLEYAQYRSSSLLTNRLLGMSPGSLVTDTDLDPDDQDAYKRAPVVSEFFRPRAMDRVLISPLRHDSDSMIFFGVRRGGSRSEYREDDKSILSQLVPHLTQVLRIQECLGRANTLVQALETSLDELTTGIVMLSEGGRVTYMNRLGESILHQEDGLALTKGGIVVASMLKANVTLQQALKDVVDPNVAITERTGDVLMVDRPSGFRPYGVLISPVSTEMREGAFASYETPTALMFIRDPEVERATVADDITGLFGFTPREAEVVSNLLQGKNIKEVAAQMELAETTTRQYVKIVLSKANARSQHELVGQVLNILPRR